MKHPALIAALLTALCLTVFLPTLGMFQFQNPMERLAITSAVETAREQGGQWLIPQLEGLPRVNKPPVQTWLSMPLLKSATITQLSNSDPASRAAAFHALAWQVRLIPVTINCLLPAAVFLLALQFGPTRFALLASLITLTSTLFLDHVRLASYDPALATWIAFTNLFLTRAILHRRLWLNLPLAAIFLALAFLTKGPIAILQSILPALLYLAWRATTSRPAPSTDQKDSAHPALPILLSSFLFLALTLPWFLYFLCVNPAALHDWYRQIFRDLPNKPDPLPTYLRILAWMLPWTPWLLIGTAFAARQTFRRRNHPLVFPFFLMIVPFSIMACFPHRTERYLLPLLPAFALLAAAPLQLVLDRLAIHPSRDRQGAVTAPKSFDRPLIALQYLILLIAALFIPIYGHWFAKTLSGTPWFSLPTTLTAVALTLLLTTLSILLQRRHPFSLLAAATLLTLASNTLYLSGWQASPKGTPEGLDLANTLANNYPPTTPIYCLLPPGRHPPSELLLYLNRVITAVDSPEKIPQHRTKIVLTSRPINITEPPPAPLPNLHHIAQSTIADQRFDAFAETPPH